jgi:hypothetical protein
MAVAVSEAQVNVTNKISLGGTRNLYIGTIAFGTEYATGGNTLAAASTSRYSLPSQIDWFDSSIGGFNAQLIGGKVQVLAPQKEKEAAAQVAAKTNLSAVTGTFFLVGC